jgi:hypothetical protein
LLGALINKIMTKRTFFFTMVNHPAKGWIRAGRAYPTKKIASSWLSFVRGAWRGLPVKVSQCTVYFEQGQICEKSKHILDIKYNLDA